MAVDLWEPLGQTEERLAKEARTVESRFRPVAIEQMALKAEKKFRANILQGKIATKSSSIKVSIREIVMKPHVTKAELEAYLKPAGLKILHIVGVSERTKQTTMSSTTIQPFSKSVCSPPCLSLNKIFL